MKDNKLYLIYTSDAIRHIERLTAEGRDGLLQKTDSQAAVLWYLQTLAEATQRLPEEIKLRQNSINGQGISDVRDRLAYGYLAIN